MPPLQITRGELKTDSVSLLIDVRNNAEQSLYNTGKIGPHPLVLAVTHTIVICGNSELRLIPEPVMIPLVIGPCLLVTALPQMQQSVLWRNWQSKAGTIHLPFTADAIC